MGLCFSKHTITIIHQLVMEYITTTVMFFQTSFNEDIGTNVVTVNGVTYSMGYIKCDKYRAHVL
jgi:hypothetical protein